MVSVPDGIQTCAFAVANPFDRPRAKRLQIAQHFAACALHMAQTTFFGLTSYGAGTAFDKTTARPLLFHEIPDERFISLFRKRALGNSEVASLLQVRLPAN